VVVAGGAGSPPLPPCRRGDLQDDVDCCRISCTWWTGERSSSFWQCMFGAVVGLQFLSRVKVESAIPHVLPVIDAPLKVIFPLVVSTPHLLYLTRERCPNSTPTGCRQSHRCLGHARFAPISQSKFHLLFGFLRL
jgi:hypothetical protein